MASKHFRQLILLVLITVFSAAGLTCVSNKDGGDDLVEFRLTVLHTNDLHGRLENIAKYSTIVKRVRSEETNVLLLDGGDLYRRGPYEHLKGAVETEIFNTMRYDAVVFGNNDFPLNDQELYNVSEHTIIKLAEFPVLCGNVTINGKYMDGFEPFIIKNMQGLGVTIIGVTSLKPRDRNFDISKRALFSDPVQTVSKLLAETSKKSDIQIVLSHAGFDTDKNMRGMSAVIGADSHTKLDFPYVIYDSNKQIPLVQAGGEEDNYLGRLDLVYEKVKKQWVLKEFKGRLFSLEEIADDAEILDILEKYGD